MPERLVPDISLPGYAYVPGGPHPHPGRPAGGGAIATVDPDQWHSCRQYLYGLDLFNHGYYWEAHEAWEELWHTAGRRGVTASFLKGLIKLAAAGVKVREGKPQGVVNHASRAAELFEHVRQQEGVEQSRFMGLDLQQLIRAAHGVAERPPARHSETTTAVEVVFDFRLWPA
jgi:predicted metal-dependent hydrolase